MTADHLRDYLAALVQLSQVKVTIQHPSTKEPIETNIKSINGRPIMEQIRAIRRELP